ncbi:MAG: hypothetical protein IJI84_01790 [Clostridia bacterium]|nr:hypothetical protein [Clostridia bacterium]
MTELKKIELTEEALDQVVGGISGKQVISALLIIGITCIAIATGINCYSNNKGEKSTSHKINNKYNTNVIYQDNDGVGHSRPHHSGDVIYQDNNGVGHFSPSNGKQSTTSSSDNGNCHNNNKVDHSGSNIKTESSSESKSGFVGFFDDK